MPGKRGSTALCEELEEVIDDGRTLLTLYRQYNENGVIESHESRVLEPVIIELVRKAEHAESRASQQDAVLSWIGTVAHAGRVTPTVKRVTREKIADEQYLEAA